MRNTLKKIAAAVLSSALLLSFAGCYSEDKTWSAKKGDTTLSTGSYIYYLSSAFSEARSKVSTDEEVLKAQITDDATGEKISGKDWVLARAENNVKAYFYLEDKFEALGLSFTEDELASMQSGTDSMWTYYKTALEEMGIAKESFHQASTVYSNMYQKVMDAVYGKGGEKEIPEEELKSFFTDNYYNYEYFYASLSKTDDEGNSVDLTDDEKTQRKEKLDGFVKKVQSGEITMENAASSYAEEELGSADNSTYYAASPTYTDSMSATIKDALDGIDEGDVTLAETTSGYYLVRRLPIVDKFQDTLEDESQLRGLVANMKREEFSDFVNEMASGMQGVEINRKALNSVSLSKIVSDDNKKGASSTASSQAAAE